MEIFGLGGLIAGFRSELNQFQGFRRTSDLCFLDSRCGAINGTLVHSDVYFLKILMSDILDSFPVLGLQQPATFPD